MKSAAWYVMHEGRRLLAATKAEARHLAQLVADKTGKAVTVRPIKPAARPKPKAAAPAMRRNPLDLHIPAYADAAERARRSRLDYLAGTKARRLAKGLRGKDRGGQVKAGERGAAKTARFAIDVRNSKEAYTLYRASRSAADQLADQFRAARYKVTIREM